MKTTLVTALIMGFITLNSASAAQQISHSDGKEKMGVVSASNAWTLDNLADELSRKADEKGASAYKIVSATGKDRLHGVAEIYR
ncbi:MAG: DUF1471 domain-containing protein [Leclercia sp.]